MTLEHFRIRFRLGQEVPDALWKTIEHQEYYESSIDYLPSQNSKGKESIKLSPSEEPSARPHKRARRSAAQAVASYSLTLLADVQTTEDQEAMALDDDDQSGDYDSVSHSVSGGTGGDDSLRQADQLALWIKNLADILHEEARQVSQLSI